jgi:hypothetical protein
MPAAVETFRDTAPDDFFDAKPLPPNWDAWTSVSIDNPSSGSAVQIEQAIHRLQKQGLSERRKTKTAQNAPLSDAQIGLEEPPSIRFEQSFPGVPGGPDGRESTLEDPAFYLPFHLYEEDWGVYLVENGVQRLAERIAGDEDLTFKQALTGTRLYLYRRESFHHCSEVFSTRLEIAHQKKVCLKGQLPLYRETIADEDHFEEALADAYALSKLSGSRGDLQNFDPDERKVFLQALRAYISTSPRGRWKGLEVDHDGAFRDAFSEAVLTRSPASVPDRPVRIWSAFNHGFHGYANITSRVKYLVHRGRIEDLSI